MTDDRKTEQGTGPKDGARGESSIEGEAGDSSAPEFRPGELTQLPIRHSRLTPPLGTFPFSLDSDRGLYHDRDRELDRPLPDLTDRLAELRLRGERRVSPREPHPDSESHPFTVPPITTPPACGKNGPPTPPGAASGEGTHPDLGNETGSPLDQRAIPPQSLQHCSDSVSMVFPMTPPREDSTVMPSRPASPAHAPVPPFTHHIPKAPPEVYRPLGESDAE